MKKASSIFICLIFGSLFKKFSLNTLKVELGLKRPRKKMSNLKDNRKVMINSKKSAFAYTCILKACVSLKLHIILGKGLILPVPLCLRQINYQNQIY